MNKRSNVPTKKCSFAIIALSALMTSLLIGCSGTSSEANSTRTFTDSCNRTVTVPKNIERIAVSGPLSQIMCFALCPDAMVETASHWDESLEGIMDERYYNLPVLGKVYNQGNLNVEELMVRRPQVIIDLGEDKGSIAADIDDLSAITGIPSVHISADFETMPEAYLKLGELVNRPQEAQILADYCSSKYDMCKKIAEDSGRKKLLYLTGSKGLNVVAKGSYPAEVIDLISDNVAIIDSPTSKGTGNEVNIEQILNWNPEYMIFSSDSIASQVASDPVWSSLDAIKNGNYYEVPYNPYNWIGAPSSIQRHLNLLWYTKVLYPDKADYDLYAEVSEYLQLFYHIDISKETYEKWQ